MTELFDSPSAPASRVRSPFELNPVERRRLLELLSLAGLASLIYIISQPVAIEASAGSVMVLLAAILPFYLWCSGKVRGIPIFPLFAFTFTWTHALPLASSHRLVLEYSPEEQLVGAAKVAGFLALATLVWFVRSRRFVRPPKSFLALKKNRADNFLLTLMFLAVSYQVSFNAGWAFLLPGGIFSVLRSSAIALNVMSVFVLSHRVGQRALSPLKRGVFFLFLTTYLLLSASTLFLFELVGLSSVATVGFVIARKRIPWKTLLLIAGCLSILHFGKGDMRTKHWGKFDYDFSNPWNYAEWYAEWIEDGLEGFRKLGSKPSESGSSSVLARSGLIHMLLYLEKRLEDGDGYLNGETYLIIPELLIPRVLNPEKTTTLEGTRMLNVHFGLQTAEEATTTTIGWGLLAEADANFGLWGLAGLAICLGFFYAAVTAWGLYTPVLSARTMFCVIVVSATLQTEWTAAVFLSAIFQATIVVFFLNFFFMRRYTFDSFTRE